jgi:hypothetical protein
MSFEAYIATKLVEIDAAIAAATCKRRAALAVHYSLYAPQLVLNAVMTGTSLVDIGVFDAQTARQMVGFAGVANVVLQALSAGFGLHRRAAELAEFRRALVMLRNDFELALTHESTETERARLCGRYLSTLGKGAAHDDGSHVASV